MNNTEIDTCEFCGKKLEPFLVELPFADNLEPIAAGFVECECEWAIEAKREKERRNEAKRKELETEQQIERYKAAGIPKYYIEKAEKQPELAEEVIFENGLYFEGSCGTGKTFTAMGIAKVLCDRGISVKVTSMRAVMRRLQSCYKNNETPALVFDALLYPYLLVLEDLGKEHVTERALTELFDVIDERKNQMKPIIVTTNYSKHELIDRFSLMGDYHTAKSIVSRLFEMTRKVPFSGNDRRVR